MLRRSTLQLSVARHNLVNQSNWYCGSSKFYYHIPSFQRLPGGDLLLFEHCLCCAQLPSVGVFGGRSDKKKKTKVSSQQSKYGVLC